MKCIFPVALLFALGGCSGGTSERPAGGDDPTGDASPAAARSDAAADDASHGAVDGDASDASDGDAQKESDASTCPESIGDAGFASLADLSAPTLCAMGNGRLLEWTTPCEGSIAVMKGEGVDCENVWLFDATTHELQATAGGCLHIICTAGAPGFVFPSACFDGTFIPTLAELCTDASTPDAN